MEFFVVIWSTTAQTPAVDIKKNRTMKKLNFVITGLVFFALVIGCKKDDIPIDEYLIFEENFQGNYTWTIDGQIDTSTVEPGEADGEVGNGVLYLHATGCTEVSATLPLTTAVLTDEEHNRMTLTVDIEEFNASPIISSDNKIEISFKNFYLIIKPKQDINNLLLVFKLNNNTIDLADQTDAIEYTFTTTSNYNKILVNLKSESIADCIALANLKLKSIKIYRK